MARERTSQRFIWTEDDEEEGVVLLKQGDGTLPESEPLAPDLPEPKEVPAPRTPAPSRSR